MLCFQPLCDLAIAGPRIYQKGRVYPVTDEVREELEALLRQAVIVIVEDDRSPIQLQTPEAGQPMTFR